MKSIFSIKSYWIISILATAVIFLSFLNLNQAYQSETDILFLPKNEVASQNLSGIMENARYIISQKNDPSLDVKRLSESNILRVSLKGQTRDQAQKLGSEQVASLITEMSRFYNIKTELDMRIMGNSTPKYITFYNPALLALLATISGFLLSLFSFWITSFIAKPEKKSVGVSTFRDRITFHEKPNKRGVKKTSEAITFSASAKAPAPQNLPVAEEPEETYFEPAKEKKQEFTPEQVKERLNQLLNGRI